MRYLLLASLLIIAACTSKPEAESLSVGQFTVSLEDDRSFTVKIGERNLLRSTATPATALSFDGKADMVFGRFLFRQSDREEQPLRGVRKSGNSLLIGSRLKLTPQAEGDRLRVDVEPQGGAYDGVQLNFDCAVHAEFLGFGEQYSYIAMKGKRVPIWTEENGLGRSENAVPPGGHLFSSYYPIPYFLDPRGMGFVSDSPAYQEFSLCENGSATWSVELWDSGRFSFYVLAGPTALDVVSQLTEVTGRPAALPDWGWELWLSAQGGEEQVRWVMEQAETAGIPYSAIWVQDWLGKREFAEGLYGVKYRWALDETYYPNFVTMLGDIHADGKKFLGYFNPFIPPDYEFFAEGAEKGYLIKDAAGEPYLFTVSVFDASLVDMTNPDAVEWFKGYARKAVDMGLDGWMSDFGEWLPWDAVLHEGTGAMVHNLYPTLWHKASREVLDEKLPGDYILFTRSGHLREAGVAQVVWAGDQEANWNIHDGFPTAVRANISLSLSGVPYVTHDIAGFSGGPSDKELWLRWVEFGAFSPIMRLHDGLRKLENWYFYSDAESAAHLARFSKIHNQLIPYLKTLAADAQEKGHPIVRHYMLVENKREYWNIEDAYFLGNDVLVAPVLEQGAKTREVVFPSGTWRGVFGHGEVQGPTTQTFDTPIGKPAVFVRVGSEAERLLGSFSE
jgi:alpha-glucosidase